MIAAKREGRVFFIKKIAPSRSLSELGELTPPMVAIGGAEK
jgi:hypothetical protein